MSTISTWPHENRRAGADRRLLERRQRTVTVNIERRSGQARRRSVERRQQDSYAPHTHSADRLCWELAKVPADNPTSRLLVIQEFLLACAPRQSNEWVMRWARQLRETYYRGNRDEMYSAVPRAVRGEKPGAPAEGRKRSPHRRPFLQQVLYMVEACEKAQAKESR